jgi:hypothetical protein
MELTELQVFGMQSTKIVRKKYKTGHDASKHHQAWYKSSSMNLIRGEKGFRNR